jgi:hypothetical protein
MEFKTEAWNKVELALSANSRSPSRLVRVEEGVLKNH